MKIHRLKTIQFIPTTLETAWDFFSSPINLKEITPEYMDFNITSDFTKDTKMYPGMLISYTVKPVLGIPITWVTEITQVNHHKHFIDEQRFGPYRMWHHEHFFKELEGGVEMTDEVTYVLPFGMLGEMGHGLFIKKQLKDIFDYRCKRVEEIFRF